MKKFILIFVAILISIKIIIWLGFTESELIIAGIIFAFYLLISKIEELQQRIKTLEYKKENEAALIKRKESTKEIEAPVEEQK